MHIGTPVVVVAQAARIDAVEALGFRTPIGSAGNKVELPDTGMCGFLCQQQALLAFAQCSLGLLFLGDVFAGAQCADDVARLIHEETVAPGDRALRAVATEHRVRILFGVVQIPRHEFAVHRIDGFHPLWLRQTDLEPVLSQQFAFAVAQQFAAVAVEHGDASFRIQRDHDVLHGVEIALVAVAFPPQGVLCRLDRGDVAGDTEDAGDIAILVMQRSLRRGKDPAAQRGGESVFPGHDAIRFHDSLVVGHDQRGILRFEDRGVVLADHLCGRLADVACGCLVEQQVATLAVFGKDGICSAFGDALEQLHGASLLSQTGLGLPACLFGTVARLVQHHAEVTHQQSVNDHESRRQQVQRQVETCRARCRGEVISHIQRGDAGGEQAGPESAEGGAQGDGEHEHDEHWAHAELDADAFAQQQCEQRDGDGEQVELPALPVDDPAVWRGSLMPILAVFDPVQQVIEQQRSDCHEQPAFDGLEGHVGLVVGGQRFDHLVGEENPETAEECIDQHDLEGVGVRRAVVARVVHDDAPETFASGVPDRNRTCN